MSALVFYGKFIGAPLVVSLIIAWLFGPLWTACLAPIITALWVLWLVFGED